MNRPPVPSSLTAVLTTAVLAIGAMVALTASPLSAGGAFVVRYGYWHERQPGPAMERFLDGELGVLDTSLRPAFLLIAYRHLSGQGLSASDRERLAEVWEPHVRSASWVDPVADWIRARGALPDLPAPTEVDTDRAMRTDQGGYSYYDYYRNCLDDAFVQATATLERYVDRYGVGGPETRAWALAQDLVFGNCSDGDEVPTPLDASHADDLRTDRDYQIGAAHFYAGRLEEARRHFESIARNTTSRHSHLASYLVGRTLYRAGRWLDADAVFTAVLQNPGAAFLHPSARGLLRTIRARTQRMEQDLPPAGLWSAEHPTGELQHNLSVLMALLDWRCPDLRCETAEWMNVVHPGGAERARLALERWRQTDSPLWLTAALMTASVRGWRGRPNDKPLTTAEVEPLLAHGASMKGEADGALAEFLTTTFHRARLLIELDRDEEARPILAAVLTRKDLTTSDRNRFLTLRAQSSATVDDFVRALQQEPVEATWDHYEPEAFHDPSGEESTPWLTPALAAFLNWRLTTARTLTLVEDEVIAPELRRRVVLTAWTRAVVLGDTASVLAVLPQVRELAPELRAEVDAYETASERERPFVAALTILRFPGFDPEFQANSGRLPAEYRADLFRRSWCRGVSHGFDPDDVFYGDHPELPKFPTPSDPEGATKEREKLAQLDAAPHYLGRIVLPWADEHRADPRMPEALHLLVKATRYGCFLYDDGDYGEISRGAFDRLHRRYKSSRWTRQTPYWFQ